VAGNIAFDEKIVSYIESLFDNDGECKECRFAQWGLMANAARPLG
jgi:hypothetical protein